MAPSYLGRAGRCSSAPPPAPPAAQLPRFRDADAPGFAIDRAQQVDGEVDVDALDLSARTKTTITRGKTKRDVAAVKVGDLVARRNGLCALGKSLASFMTDVDCVAPCAILGTC
ncbi:MAG: hypothetical protein DMF93_08165 [Acidobacteria bacterium]|nr:MAG: hypothetical protein DMF93_08165 [Acidobacteriota bacterium]